MERAEQPAKCFCLDVAAAYNGGGLPLEDPGVVRVDDVEQLMAHPYFLAHLTSREMEEVLMELWVARRRMQ